MLQGLKIMPTTSSDLLPIRTNSRASNFLLSIHLSCSTVTNEPWHMRRQSPLNISSVLGGSNMTCWQGIERIFSLVKLSILDHEDNAGNEGYNGYRAIIPDEQRIFGQWDESLAYGLND